MPVIYGYCSQGIRNKLSLFYLICGIPPSVSQTRSVSLLGDSYHEDHQVCKMLLVQSIRAKNVSRIYSHVESEVKQKTVVLKLATRYWVPKVRLSGSSEVRSVETR